MSVEFDRLKANVQDLKAADAELIALVEAIPSGPTEAEFGAVADDIDAERAKVQAAIDAHNQV